MTTAITVPFHGNELFIVEHKDQPYTPMKPIVDGMGLDWGSQFTKLKQRFAKGIVEIAIPSKGGLQNMTCLPVRKLFGWLMTISPNKVRPELRDIIIMYQNECDDVLWDYWTKGQAINQRLTITPEQQAELHQIVDDRAQGSRSIHMEMWARHNRHFKIAKYSQLLAVHFDDAKLYLQTMELKGKPSLTSNSGGGLLSYEEANKIITYWRELHQEIKRLGGKLPQPYVIDEQKAIAAIVSDMIVGSRMLVSFNFQNEPVVKLIPKESWILNEHNIAQMIGVAGGISDEVLPEIIHAAVNRLATHK